MDSTTLFQDSLINDSVNVIPEYLNQVPPFIYKGLLIFLIVVAFFLIFKKPISELIGRIKKIKPLGVKFERPKQEPVKKILEEMQDIKMNQIIRGLQLFHHDTITHYRNEVIKATNIENLEHDIEKIDNLIQYSEALLILVLFERIYYLIFGSQILLLQHLNSIFSTPKDEFKFYFDTAAERDPRVFKDFDFDKYLNFLISNNLINEDENGNIVISILGRDFLKFIIEEGLSDYKPY